MQPEPLRRVPRPEGRHRIRRQRRRRWDLGQRSAIRPSELERAVGQALELLALLVHRAVMAAAE